MTTILTDDFVVLETEAYSTTAGEAVFAWGVSTPITLENHGLITSQGSTHAIAFDAGFDGTGEIINYGRVEAIAPQGSAFGLQLPPFGSPLSIHNLGEWFVSGGTQAGGLISALADQQVINEGLWRVEAQSIAYGLFCEAGGDLVNTGTIEVVSDATALAVNFDQFNGDSIVNDGIIRAVGGGPSFGIVGVRVAGADGALAAPNITNTGEITAPTAITGSGIRVWLANSGVITGAISLGDVADRIDNTNLIDGEVATGSGSDVVDNTGGTITGAIDLGAGVDTLLGGAGREIAVGGSGDDNLDAGGGADDLAGGEGLDTLSGGDGDDVIAGGAGADALSGGAGVDTVDYSASASAVTVDLATQTASGGDATGDTLSGFESAVGSGLDDSLTGDAGANTLAGGAGDDLLDGGSGSDALDGGEGTDTASFASVGFFLGVFVNLATSSAEDHGTGHIDALAGIENVIGSSSGDALHGDAFANTLRGADGNDHIFGAAGDDVLLGESGHDTLISSDDADIMDGGADGDLGDTASYQVALAPVQVSLAFEGVAQNTGGAGFDTLIDIEILAGSDFGDTLTGSSLDDELRGFGGDDTLLGGDGDDALNGGDFETFVTTDGADTLRGEGGDDWLVGGVGDDALFGGAGDDALEGQHGADIMQGGDGDDLFYVGIAFGTGVDAISGDSGVDELFYWSAAEAVIVQLGAGYAATAGGVLLHTLSGVENVIGTLFGDTLVGNSTDNRFTDGFGGGGGADWMVGGAGNDRFQLFESFESGAVDRLFGDEGFDTIDYNGYTSAGITVQLGLGYTTESGVLIETFSGMEAAVGTFRDDALIGSDGANHLTGGDGSDWIVGGGGDDTFFQGHLFSEDVDRLFGGTPGADAGFDTIDYSAAGGGVIIQLSGYAARTDGTLLATFSGVEAAVGGIFDDSLIGNAANNRFDGGAGSDWIVGGAGDDWFVQAALPGVDRLFGGTAGGDAGVDTIDYSTAAVGVTVQLNGWAAISGGATLATFSGIENAIGTAFADALIGNASNNVITGGAGADWLVGADGDDTFVQGVEDGGVDRLFGDAGIDTLDYSGAAEGVIVQLSGYSTTSGSALLATFSGIEAAIGTNFDDALIGDAAGNNLIGAAGADWLVGGAGADTFVYLSAASGSDVIADFSRADLDRIDLSAIDADPTQAGDQFFTLATQRTSGAAGQAVLENFGASSLVSLYLDADNIADMTIQVVHQAGLIMNAGDFVL